MTSHAERRAFRKLGIGLLACFSFLLLLPAAPITIAHPQEKSISPAQIKVEAALLEPGKPIEKALSGGETDSYAIQAKEGQFLHAIVEQLGIHVVLTLSSPDRKLIASMENPNRTAGMQQISAIARSKGAYTLELASADKNAPPGRYRVSVGELRAPSPADRARITAERAFKDAGDLYAEGGGSSSMRAAQKYEETLPLWRSASEAYEESVTLNILGMIYLNLGARQKALDYFNQALPLKRVVSDYAGEAMTLNNIGAIYNANGERGKALEQFTSVLAFERDTGEQTVQPETLCYLGMVYTELGQPDAALADFEQALPLARQLGDQRLLPPVLNDIGKAHDDLGEKQKALDYYNQALILDRTLHDHEGESKALSNIGMVYDDLGDNGAALDSYGEALKIELQLHASNEEAATRNNIASVYDELGQERKALAFYHHALSLWRKLGDIAGEAMTLNNVGFAYHNLGQDQKALTYYNQALPILRGVDDRGAVAMTLHNIGVSEDSLGRTQEASNNLNQSLLLFLQVQDPLGQGLTLGDLMSHSRDRENPNSAIFFGKEAVNSYQQVRRNITGLPNNLQKSFIASKESTYRELADLLITQGRLEEAQQVLDLLKEEEYFEFIRRDGKDATSLTASVEFTNLESEMNSRYEESASSITAIGIEWATLHAKLSRTLEENQRFAKLNEKLKLANQVWENFCSDLYAELKASNGSQAPRENIDEFAGGMKSELRILGPGTVALYTLVGGNKYRIILVTSTVTLAREYPIGAADLRRKVFEFRQALQDPSKDPEPLAHELYRILVGPVASELEGAQATTLMWSLDDVLRYLPISALHDGHDYLVAKYRSEVFTPASMSHLSDRSNVKTWLGVAMGVSKAYGKFSPLPSVPEELHRVIKEKDTPGDEGVLPGQTMLDDTFTEDNMKKALEKRYPLVHIASHFDFEPGNETNSFLLLGGAGTQGQHLTLAEIRKDPEFDFSGTDLLTLSVCDTAMGGSSGDGREVDGLGILAQQKGARAVVASLWAVNDKSTGALMHEFYRLWTTSLAGMPKAEALRQAQLMMLRGKSEPEEGPGSASVNATSTKDQTPPKRGVHPNSTATHSSYPQFSHPYYWAPFILIGNWQ